MTNKGLIYLACPYSHESADIREFRFVECCKAVAQGLKHGIPIFSPIAHTHPVVVHGGLEPNDIDLFFVLDEAILPFCVELWILQLPGWEESKGIDCEVGIANKNGLTLRHVYWKKDKA